jgi:hypothetical protein
MEFFYTVISRYCLYCLDDKTFMSGSRQYACYQSRSPDRLWPLKGIVVRIFFQLRMNAQILLQFNAQNPPDGLNLTPY